jgi:hypothetical protein
VGSVSVEPTVEELIEPLEVCLQPAPDLVGEVGSRRAMRLRRGIEQRMHTRRRVAGGRNAARIEVEVQADRAAVLGPKGRKLAQSVEAHHRCRHTAPFCLAEPDSKLPENRARGTPRGSDSFSIVRAHMPRSAGSKE